jgi:hypothetical protein
MTPRPTGSSAGPDPVLRVSAWRPGSGTVEDVLAERRALTGRGRG